ncbi:MAG: efflux RND transporter periplasmic adaptor subunit [Phenylobacterium sp.]|uniref:efflux RND transporter periplasmic adaptor subunit n=1 Tax=Phenylobacterium sp. TaxID=1871053 RepID=UPI00391D68E8
MFALFRSRRTLWLAGAAVLLIGAGGAVFATQASAQKEKAAQAAAVAPKSPYLAVANGKADVEGGLIEVAARSAGVVREVLVQEGDDVVKGQVLARLEDDEPRLAARRAAAEVEQARAQVGLLQVQLSSARREYERLRALSSSNFVAGQKLDQAQDKIREAEANLAVQRADIATAQARLEEARYNLELTVIRAPADGRIVRRYANPGAGASTLNVSTMFDLEPSARRIVRAEISEGALPYVSVGQAVQIAPEADPDKSYKGVVLRRAGVFGARKLQSEDPTQRADERVVEVVVSADETPFLVGQRVLVKFMRSQTASAKALPPNA